MIVERHQFQLLVESLAPVAAPAAAGAGLGAASSALPALVVPPEPAWLWTREGGPPKIAGAKPGRAACAVLLEPVVQRRQPRLLLVRGAGVLVLVNGQPAPRFSVLKERDTLRLDGDALLHVTVYHRPVIGPPPAEWIGKECPFCRVPFVAASKCYVCACSAVLHCEDAGQEDSLECARLRGRAGCLACQRPIVLEPGYAYLPEGTNEPF